VRLLGAGGMGEVYEAVDTTLAERVALKTIGAAAPLDAEGVARIKAEVETARRVTHPNVCRVFDVGFHVEPARSVRGDDLAVPFLTMELLSGETLRARVAREERLHADEALALLAQMAAGLDAAHAAGVIHADLKSENVMLVPRAGDGFRAVIMDFGLARHYRAGSHASRSSGGLVGGTVGYMAPEQLQGGRPGPAGDLYALGVLLFEMLTGELPFRGSSPLAVALASVGGAPPSLRSFAIESPAGWEDVLRKSLDPEPVRRFVTGAAMVEALHSARSLRRLASRRSLVLAGALAAVSAATVLAVRSRPAREAKAEAALGVPIETPRPSILHPPGALADEVTGPPPVAPDPPAPAVRVPASRRAALRPAPATRSRQAPILSVPETPGDDDAIDPYRDR
jgi:serine/threonine protein kinase